MDLNLKLKHVGINSNPAEADALIGAFCHFLGIPAHGPEKIAGGMVEVMKNPKRGKIGHIAFSTPSIENALTVFKERGYTLDETSVSKNDKGQITVAYFNENLAGFALHLVKE